MSEPTTYEQLIALKLEELIVPDHANAIWATIEQQLNIEMPTNGGSSGTGGFNKPDWWLGGGFFTIIVAIIMYVAISKQNLRSNKLEKEKPAIIHLPSPEQVRDSLNQPKPNVILKGVPTTASKSIPQSADVVKQSSTAVVDSIASSKATADPAVQAAPIDTLPKQKKSRGVKGITDADYRIEPSQKNPKE